MERYHWSEKICTGINAIDDQHKYLIDCLNKLGDAISNNITENEILAILHKMQKYAILHFETEEKFMQNAYYSSTHKNTHMNEHNKFILEVEHLLKNFKNGNNTIATDIYTFLGSWLVFHIMNTDIILARSIKLTDYDCKNNMRND